jgi:hypothetical protein
MTDIIVRKPNKNLAKNDPFAGLMNVTNNQIANVPGREQALNKMGGMMQARDINGITNTKEMKMLTAQEKKDLPKRPDSLKYLTVSDILTECAGANFESLSHSGKGESGKGGHISKEWTDVQGHVHREYTDEGEYRCSVATLAEWLHKGYKCPDPIGEHDQSYLVAKKYKLKFADYNVRCPLCGGMELQEVELAYHMSAAHSLRVPKVAYELSKFEMKEGIF